MDTLSNKIAELFSEVLFLKADVLNVKMYRSEL